MKTLLRWIVRLLYGFRAHNTGVLRTPGPVLLIPNHVSWLDWLFLYVLLDDDWKFVTSSTTAETNWLTRKIMVNRRTFPVDHASPYAVRDMAEHLARGGRLVLFAEGRISLTGSLMKIFEGTGFLVGRTGASVITCYLRGANRLPLVRHRGWTKRFPRVSAHFSDVLRAPRCDELPGNEARGRLTTWLHDAMVRQQFETELAFGPQNVLAAIAETAAAIPGRVALQDHTLAALTYRRTLIGADVLAHEWESILARDAAARVGVLLPNANATPVVLLSLWRAGRVPALLNYSSGAATMLACARLAGLRHVITSRLFIEKAKLDVAPLRAAGLELIFLGDVRAAIGVGTKIAAVLEHTLACGARIRRSELRGDDTAVVLFTSGSEGTPKGVELSHRNLLANVHQACAMIDVTDDDRFFNALPLFHSFGLTGGTLFPLVRGCYTFLYPSPLHYRAVPALVYDRACTVLLGTNTFLAGYARKAHAYDFNSVRFLMAGAEKVQSATFDLWARKFGVRILEGYGATECSPLISVNTRLDPAAGTAGRFVPGLDYRLEPVDGVSEGGRLFVRGPNVMKGYLNADANAAFRALAGWYDTGDLALVDAGGFLHLLGRMKRFAKVSGEMVSLTAVEDALAGAFPHLGARCQVAVIAQPDAEKGEKLVAATNDARLTLAEIRAAVRAKGLSNLCTPRELRVVRTIPKLGTGKTDHRALARELATAPVPAPAEIAIMGTRSF
ncbi:MAG: AMP-binding protein [Opitutae bacterium]|nr:AMP-binding protein [Opitutae bacterium]